MYDVKDGYFHIQVLHYFLNERHYSLNMVNKKGLVTTSDILLFNIGRYYLIVERICCDSSRCGDSSTKEHTTLEFIPRHSIVIVVEQSRKYILDSLNKGPILLSTYSLLVYTHILWCYKLQKKL